VIPSGGFEKERDDKLKSGSIDVAVRGRTS